MNFDLIPGTVPIINLQKLIVSAEADRLGLVDHDTYIRTIKKLMELFNISEKEDTKNDHQD